jgi:hypothetical protein
VKGRTVASVLGVGLAGSQAGHLLAYAMRYGPAAQQVQSTGVHAYFPSLAKTVVGLAALAAVATLLLIAVARMIGKRAERDSASSYLRLLAVLFTLQLAAFAVQETAEAILFGTATSMPLVLVWGTVGQLPVAAAGALALRWLLARLNPALAQLALVFRPVLQLVADITALVVFPVATEMVLAAEPAPAAFNRRGPPSF